MQGGMIIPVQAAVADDCLFGYTKSTSWVGFAL